MRLLVLAEPLVVGLAAETQRAWGLGLALARASDSRPRLERAPALLAAESESEGSLQRRTQKR